MQESDQNAPEVTSYRFDRFTIDLRSACLRSDETPVPLRPKSFDVLVYLVRNRGRLVSKDELFEKVWSDVIVTDNSLVQCIKDVRQALKDDSQTIIETVARRGYIFAPAVGEFHDTKSSAVPPVQIVADVPLNAELPATGPSRRSIWIAGTSAGAFIVALLAAGIFWLAFSPTASRDPLTDSKRLAIAVMPFGAPDAASDDYISTGLSEDITAALGRFSDLAVASPRVVARFRDVGVSAEDIERQLKVRYLVEGSVRRSPETIRITVRLTDLQRGLLKWSHTYDVSSPTISTVQDEIALQIAGTLSVRLTNLEQRRAAGKSVANMEAYDFLLRGREFLTRLNRTSYSQARTMFEHAIALAPGYSAAYVGLGRVDLSAVAMGWTANASEAFERAERLARKAISLDEFNPAAHVLLGRTYVRTRQYDRAVEILKRAVALNPSDPDSYAGLGDALLWSGNSADAIKSLETAISMDPGLSAEDLFSLGTAYFIEGRTEDSMRVFERATNRNEGNPFIYAMLAAVYSENGREAEARSAALTVRQLNPFFDVENFGTLFKNPEHREKLAKALKKTGI